MPFVLLSLWTWLLFSAHSAQLNIFNIVITTSWYYLCEKWKEWISVTGPNTRSIKQNLRRCSYNTLISFRYQKLVSILHLEPSGSRGWGPIPGPYTTRERNLINGEQKYVWNENWNQPEHLNQPQPGRNEKWQCKKFKVE
jgi:hypothetical protein